MVCVSSVRIVNLTNKYNFYTFAAARDMLNVSLSTLALQSFNPLTAGVAYNRVFNFY